jgi:tetratricopeptide (TPR) repeat protein
MGTVHLAEVADPVAGLEVGDRVALKVVHPHLLESPGFFKRFVREGELGRKVDHASVVRTFDADAMVRDGEHFHYLVMEYVEGRNLRELLGDLGAVNETLLREIALQTAEGLAAIHAHGIIHRDLKPENILITGADEVRIMDLGVAKLQEASVAITKEGQFAGSVLYAAPEQFRRDDPVGPGADLYSLGVLLFELAAGKNPFQADDAAGVVTAHLNEDAPRLRERNPDVSLFFSEVVGTLLAKDPHARFASADALADVLRRAERSDWWAEREPEERERDASVPRARVARDTGLYGREDGMATLRDAWERATRGDGNIVFVEGEAGIGKSRLVDELLRGLAGSEAHVLYGSYPPSGGLGGFSDAVLSKFGEVRLAESVAPYLTVTPALVPAFAALVKHDAPPQGTEPLRGEALQSVAVHLMRALAAEKPVLWVLEDLHSAPQESRNVVLAMARALADHRVLLVATARPGVDLADLSRLAWFRRIDLGRLSPREVLHLLQDALGSEALADRLGAKIALKSDGVPFFVFEMIRSLKEGRFITEQPDGSYVQSQVVADIDVPSAVKDLIEQRMHDLSTEQRAVLEAGAVQGLTFEPSLVAAVLEEKKVRVLQQVAEVERRFGLVRGEAGLCRFDQNQIQEVLYRDLLPDLRSEYHALLAEAHAERCGSDPELDDAVFLARHHLLGSRPEGAAPHLQAAFEHLERSNGFEAILELSERALEAPGLLDEALRVDVLLDRVRSLDALGRRDEQRKVIDEALALADRLGDPSRAARARRDLGWHLNQVGAYVDARAPLEEAVVLAHAAGDAAMEGRAISILGSICANLGSIADARRYYERALAMVEAANDPGTLAPPLNNLANTRLQAGEIEEARALYTRALEASRAASHKLHEAAITGNLGGVASRLGQSARALEFYGRGRELSRELGNRFSESINVGNVGAVLAGLGRNDEAGRCFESQLSLTREVGHRRGEANALAGLAQIAFHGGDADEEERLLELALAVRREIGHRDGVVAALQDLAALQQRTGRTDDAATTADEALAIAREVGTHGPILLSSALRASLHGGDPEAALADLDAHEALADKGDRIQARFLLWQATGDPAHLDRAHVLLLECRDDAPEQDRDSMLENVPLARAIIAAVNDRG